MGRDETSTHLELLFTFPSLPLLLLTFERLLPLLILPSSRNIIPAEGVGITTYLELLPAFLSLRFFPLAFELLLPLFPLRWN